MAGLQVLAQNESVGHDYSCFLCNGALYHYPVAGGVDADGTLYVGKVRYVAFACRSAVLKGAGYHEVGYRLHCVVAGYHHCMAYRYMLGGAVLLVGLELYCEQWAFASRYGGRWLRIGQCLFLTV